MLNSPHHGHTLTDITDSNFLVKNAQPSRKWPIISRIQVRRLEFISSLDIPLEHVLLRTHDRPREIFLSSALRFEYRARHFNVMKSMMAKSIVFNVSWIEWTIQNGFGLKQPRYYSTGTTCWSLNFKLKLTLPLIVHIFKLWFDLVNRNLYFHS